MVQASTIVTASVATAVTGLLAYAAYFDYKRRSQPAFRRELRRNERLAARNEKEEAKLHSHHQRQKVKDAVAAAVAEGFPQDPSEKEMYFMEQVSKGEVLSSDPNSLFESAFAFYRALKVYPSPGDLIGIYDQTVSKQVLDILAEIIAADPTLKIGANAEESSDSGMPPTVGLD
ncbi:related to mitochondrial import receptor subunit tom-20 [Cephalotrichum gorgonifer]|uniref:Related to mitochondrial import receptor subunit tom-20 n=1 Tax=Cephalotrichum gorgonifer TaxID=2041049 RepID=A0AAE8SZA7_9PEZI|nr:related to mitochondrial import receptor subunit tom-20 [Cephalotrichum gorgonifer]